MDAMAVSYEMATANDGSVQNGYCSIHGGLASDSGWL